MENFSHTLFTVLSRHTEIITNSNRGTRDGNDFIRSSRGTDPSLISNTKTVVGFTIITIYLPQSTNGSDGF
jgi:hypothetical protein